LNAVEIIHIINVRGLHKLGHIKNGVVP